MSDLLIEICTVDGGLLEQIDGECYSNDLDVMADGREMALEELDRLGEVLVVIRGIEEDSDIFENEICRSEAEVIALFERA